MGWEVIAQKGIEIAIKAGLFEKIPVLLIDTPGDDL